jgi:hypothetical protein
MILAVITCALLLGPAQAQNQNKPWTEWSKKEVERILNDSGWGQTQTESLEAQPASAPAISTSTVGRDANSSGNSGGNQPQVLRFRVRLLSAKPVRAAIAQMLNLQQASPNPQLAKQMQPFIDRNFGEFIVVAVTLETNSQAFAAPSMKEMSTVTAETFKDKAYLERKDGKRLSLMDFRAPVNDGLGAKFIFPRMLDGQPFLDKESGELLFKVENGKRFKLHARFKVKDMNYEGNLEY